MSENSSNGKTFELKLGQRVVFKRPGRWDVEVFVTGIHRNPEGHSHHYVFSALPSSLYQGNTLMTSEVERLVSEGILHPLGVTSDTSGGFG